MELKKGQCGCGMVSGRESINEIREAGRTRWYKAIVKNINFILRELINLMVYCEVFSVLTIYFH